MHPTGHPRCHKAALSHDMDRLIRDRVKCQSLFLRLDEGQVGIWLLKFVQEVIPVVNYEWFPFHYAG